MGVTSLSVFFPAYNDAPSVPKLVEAAFQYGRQVTSDLEVIVVDDGSSDGTAAAIEALQEKYGPALRLIRHGANRGYGGALQSGFAAATKDFVFYTDGDGQYDVSQLPELAARMSGDVGLVNGYKVSRSDSWHRVVVGKVYLRAVRAMFGLSVQDVDCDFRLIRRSLLIGEPLRSNSGSICVELCWVLERSGWRRVDVPVRHLPRLHGRSQFFRFSHVWRTMRDLSGLFWDLQILGGTGRAVPQVALAPESD